ncbi:hypothetical protein, partial [Mobiluncus mulieris]|uniref:hypothetical protein n=1 Tax=Mobiluncus mulieris TaxID=2052 RepID=UPI001B8D1F8C
MKELKAIGASETTVKGKMPFVMLVGGKSAVPDKTGIKGACQVFCVSGVWFVILLGIFRGSLGLVLVVLSASYSR